MMSSTQRKSTPIAIRLESDTLKQKFQFISIIKHCTTATLAANVIKDYVADYENEYGEIKIPKIDN